MLKNSKIFKFLCCKYRLLKHRGLPEEPIFDIALSVRGWLMLEKKDELEELLKGCKFEMVGDMECMSWASPAYMKLFNKINDDAINLMCEMDISKYKGSVKKHKIEVWLSRPGLLIGYKGELKKFIEEDLNIKLKIHEDNHTPKDQILGLGYCRCVNNIEDLL